ncbi:outer membrane protein assembly factor BamE [Leeia sp.]|uniref:outer membrane protein assembly factor BamE n=1 Tax=Leeia sp. TaxID=2884678 RepID=UPI0035B33553
MSHTAIRPVRRLLVPALMATLLAACSLSALKPYKLDIPQGNYVTQDAVDKLKLGMTRSQVRFLLGTPLVQDAFHADRWDYVYQLTQRGETVEDKRFSVWFEGDKLVKFEGTVMPALRPYEPLNGEKAASAPAAAEQAASAPKS